jgi:hypothetical protein
MGMLNNNLTEVLNNSKTTPLETIAVLKLFLTRLERSFEVSVMPKRIEGKK